MTFLSLSNVSVCAGAIDILSDISFQIRPSEIITIVGPNGSGKTTLLKTIIGARALSSGLIARKSGFRIGYVPQKLHIDPTLPLTAQRFLSLARHSTRAKIHAAMEQTGCLQLAKRFMCDLSGGQFQKVLLARALMGTPELLLLDEPTQGLDQPASAAFYKHIEHLSTSLGCAVLMVNHDLNVVMAASDKVICLNGHICCQGRPDIVANAPQYRALFGPGASESLALYRHEHSHSHDSELDTCAHHHRPALVANTVQDSGRQRPSKDIGRQRPSTDSGRQRPSKDSGRQGPSTHTEDNRRQGPSKHSGYKSDDG